ncbi:ABC transporter permease [Chelativorans intermedius]|uniref:ABC transporter permease n=1 Tax=Chelativorans intermedius TaxID=515947 RepID=A0ABV6D2K4_9HYPH|nr:ABC transporter permease [Chelativorans intermedius]MCT8997314.1 ABC transporter permease [Chelativorans intermedius]
MTRSGILSRLLSVYGLLFFAFIYAPILLIVVFSFNANPVNMMIWDGFTLDWYRTIFGFPSRLTESTLYVESTRQLYAAVRNSLLVALVASSVSTIFGTAIALAVARYRFRLRSFYRAFMFMPMIMPDIVLGIALLIFFVSLGAQLSIYTIMIGHCTFLISYVFIVVSARIADMDDKLEEASADLGANPWQTFRRVTLPLILPGVVGGGLLAFIISMDDLVITYFIAGVDSTTLPVFIYGMLRRGIKPEINAIATIMLVFSILVASAGLYLRARRK